MKEAASGGALYRTVLNRRSQSATAHAQPFWLRLVASFCVLLTFGVGVAQAAHIHGSLLPQSHTHVEKSSAISPLNSGEEHCQLCQAMHSALPATGSHASSTLPLTRSVAAVQMERVPENSWHFVMFSRPPPAAAIA